MIKNISCRQIVIYLVGIFLFASCVGKEQKNKEENEEQKYKEEYEEIAKSFPSKFAEVGTTSIYNTNKEYLIKGCWSFEGFGLEITDLSKLDYEQKIIELKVARELDRGSGAQYKWLNAYIHEVIDNYNNYGETFLLIWPHGQQYPNEPKK